MKLKKTVSKFQTEMKDANLLIEMLLNAEDGDDIITIISFIQRPWFLADSNTLLKVIQLIDRAAYSRPHLLKLYSLIFESKEIIQQIKRLISPDDVCFSLTNNTFRLLLYENGATNFEAIKRICFHNDCCFKFFFNIIKQEDKEFFEERLKRFEIIEEIESVDLSHHIIQQKEGHNESLIAKLIQNDNIEEFQNLCSSTNLLNDKIQIDFSYYESNDLMMNEFLMPSLIEYAAFFGSVKIFKFLFLQEKFFKVKKNRANMFNLFDNNEYSFSTPKLAKYAIAGGNIEIIHLVETLKTNFLDNNNGIVFNLNNQLNPNLFINPEINDNPNITNENNNKYENENENGNIKKHDDYEYEDGNVNLNETRNVNGKRNINENENRNGNEIFFANENETNNSIIGVLISFFFFFFFFGVFNNESLETSIKFHRNAIYFYLTESIGLNVNVTTLEKSIESNNFEVFYNIVEYHPKLLTEKTEDLQTMIHIAVQSRNFEMVKFFVEIDMLDINSKDANGVKFKYLFFCSSYRNKT